MSTNGDIFFSVRNDRLKVYEFDGTKNRYGNADTRKANSQIEKESTYTVRQKQEKKEKTKYTKNMEIFLDLANQKRKQLKSMMR